MFEEISQEKLAVDREVGGHRQRHHQTCSVVALSTHCLSLSLSLDHFTYYVIPCIDHTSMGTPQLALATQERMPSCPYLQVVSPVYSPTDSTLEEKKLTANLYAKGFLLGKQFCGRSRTYGVGGYYSEVQMSAKPSRRV